MKTWKTFWLEPSGRSRIALRRYTPGSMGFDCATGFHQAIVWTGDEIDTVFDPDRMDRTGHVLLVPGDDERWPVRCHDCGFVFTDADERQVWAERLFRRADDGTLRVLHSRHQPPDVASAEAGAMWHADWMPEQWVGADGISLMVRCPRNDLNDELPGSDWPVDMPSTNSGGRWTRSGDPRLARVTASPSISIGVPGRPGSYHGWLHNGELSHPL